jgi:hypothetical protein
VYSDLPFLSFIFWGLTLLPYSKFSCKSSVHWTQSWLSSVWFCTLLENFFSFLGLVLCLNINLVGYSICILRIFLFFICCSVALIYFFPILCNGQFYYTHTHTHTHAHIYMYIYRIFLACQNFSFHSLISMNLFINSGMHFKEIFKFIFKIFLKTIYIGKVYFILFVIMMSDFPQNSVLYF